MATVITDEQRISLRHNPRFEGMTRAAVSNYASYLHFQDGTALPPGLNHVDWAKQRFLIAESIVQNPNGQDVQSWVAQFAIGLRGAEVWVADPEPMPDGKQYGDATIDYMIQTNKFDELANQTFVLRAQNVRYA